MAEKEYIERERVAEKLRGLADYYSDNGLFGLMGAANECACIVERDIPVADVVW